MKNIQGMYIHEVRRKARLNKLLYDMKICHTRCRSIEASEIGVDKQLQTYPDCPENWRLDRREDFTRAIVCKLN